MKRLTKILMVFLISFILIPCTKVYGADIDDITFMRAHINESGGTNTNLLKFEDIDNKTVQVTAPSATVKVVSSCSAVEPGAIDSNGEPSCSSFVERNASGHDLFKPAPKQVKLVKINANSQDGKKIKVRYNNIGTYNGKPVGCEVTISDIPDVDQPTYFQFSSVFSYGIHYWHAHGHKQHYKFFYTNDEIDVDFEGQGAYISINSFNKWPDASGKGTFGYKSAGGDQPGVETDESIWFGGSGYKTTKINFTEIYLGENMEPVKDDFNRLIIRPKKDVQDDRHHNKPNETKYSEAFLKNSIMLHINGNLEFFVDNSNLRYGFSRQYVWMELSTDMVFKTDDYNYDVDVACRNCNNTSSNKIAYVIQDTPEWDAIFASEKYSGSKNTNNVYEYFHKVDNAFCRESYVVRFHNANEEKQFNTETGRYFTVNEISEKVMYKARIPDFNPIEVKKTTECRSDGTMSQDTKNKLAKSFKVTDEESCQSSPETGIVTLKYEDKSKVYNFKKDLCVKKEKSKVEENFEGNQYTRTVTSQYSLPTNTYRYVLIKNGLSQNSKPSEAYHDVGIENIPIEYDAATINLKENQDKWGSITLTYNLPEKSGLSKSFNTNNDYFGTQSQGNNVYADKTKLAKYKNSTACYIMYGNGKNFDVCVGSRLTNSAGDCYRKIKGKDDFYVCDVHVCKLGEHVCSNGKCSVNQKCVLPSGSVECPEECKYGCCDNDGTCAIGVQNGNPICPSSSKPIYRPIDLQNPFPSKSGNGRNTGTNWCHYGYNPVTKVASSSCLPGNALVSDKIFKARGAENYGIYNLKPLYEFELDSFNIRTIKNYNDKNKYSDFNLKCDEKNNVCTNPIIRKEIPMKNTSLCTSGEAIDVANCGKG